jgi:hypothetical protein
MVPGNCRKVGQTTRRGEVVSRKLGDSDVKNREQANPLALAALEFQLAQRLSGTTGGMRAIDIVHTMRTASEVEAELLLAIIKNPNTPHKDIGEWLGLSEFQTCRIIVSWLNRFASLLLAGNSEYLG